LGRSHKIIHNIELENFKGYRKADGGESKKFDLDADLILVTGKNGVGKTSLLEAIDWVLNQPDEGAGDYLTSGEKTGAVRINGETFNLEGKTKVDRHKLNTVASFFYQENIAELACNEIIQLLEPENKPATEIRQGLKALQSQLENWQRTLYDLRYSKNYDEERKKLAAKVSQLLLTLPEQSHLRKELGDITLTLKNGNLQNKWDSQIKNLSENIGLIGHLVAPIGANLPQHLNHIGANLLEYRAQKKTPSGLDKIEAPFDKSFLSMLRELPKDLKIKKWEGNVDLLESDISNTLYITPEANIYAETIKKLQKSQEFLQTEYQCLTDMMVVFQGSDQTLTHWTSSFKKNVDDWLFAWNQHAEKPNISAIKVNLQAQIESLESLSNERYLELKEQLLKVENKGRRNAFKLNNTIRMQEKANKIGAHAKQLAPILSKQDVSINELEIFVTNSFNEKHDQNLIDTKTVDETKIAHELGAIFNDWSELEIQKQIDDKNATDIEKIKLAENLIIGAIAICKQEAGARSQLLSIIGVIPKAELEQLVQNMNNLLASFHFPEDFLPISLENNGTDKSPKWGFKTHSNVNFEDLSTGQKSQLAICWTINLNLALTDQLGHSVIGFDDFTTSLDMNQMIPAAVLLRKLAYANNDASWKRQVIVTSHHEDLTNRLLDFLLPPSGKSMKVIQFEDWSVTKGPSFKCYNVDMGNVEPEGLEAAIKRVVK